jgi:hypothetical protein
VSTQRATEQAVRAAAARRTAREAARGDEAAAEATRLRSLLRAACAERAEAAAQARAERDSHRATAERVRELQTQLHAAAAERDDALAAAAALRGRAEVEGPQEAASRRAQLAQLSEQLSRVKGINVRLEATVTACRLEQQQTEERLRSLSRVELPAPPPDEKTPEPAAAARLDVLHAEVGRLTRALTAERAAAAAAAADLERRVEREEELFATLQVRGCEDTPHSLRPLPICLEPRERRGGGSTSPITARFDYSSVLQWVPGSEF